MIKDSEIGGIELEFAVAFNPKDDRKYIDMVAELQDEISEAIKKCGHNFVIGTGNPIKKEELK